MRTPRTHAQHISANTTLQTNAHITQTLRHLILMLSCLPNLPHSVVAGEWLAEISP